MRFLKGIACGVVFCVPVADSPDAYDPVFRYGFISGAIILFTGIIPLLILLVANL